MNTDLLFNWILEHLNYWTITAFMAIESSFIPFPSEFVVPPAAYNAASGQPFSLSLLLHEAMIVVFATIGADLGALVNYYLAYYLGRPIVYRFANSRIGHMCLIDEEKVKKAERYFEEHGAFGTFVGRLIPEVRQLISIPAGLARLNIAKFLLYTTLGAAIWNTILTALGWYVSTLVPKDQMMTTIKQYNSELTWIMLGMGVLVVLYLCYKGWKK